MLSQTGGPVPEQEETAREEFDHASDESDATTQDDSDSDESDSDESEGPTEMDETNQQAESALFLQQLLQALGHPNFMPELEQSDSHDGLCERMRAHVSVDAVANAFENVDRAHFIGEENMEAREQAYADRPYRAGMVHLSAPSIYAQALEALNISPGLSFLNIGCATLLTALFEQRALPLRPAECMHPPTL